MLVGVLVVLVGVNSLRPTSTAPPELRSKMTITATTTAETGSSICIWHKGRKIGQFAASSSSSRPCVAAASANKNASADAAKEKRFLSCGCRASGRAGRIALCGLALSMSQLSSLSSSGTLIVKVKKQLWCSDWTRGERKQCVRTSNSFAARPSSVLSAHSRRLRCVRFTPANRLCRRAIWRNIRAQVGQRQLINKLEQQQHNR